MLREGGFSTVIIMMLKDSCPWGKVLSEVINETLKPGARYICRAMGPLLGHYPRSRYDHNAAESSCQFVKFEDVRETLTPDLKEVFRPLADWEVRSYGGILVDVGEPFGLESNRGNRRGKF